MRGSDSSVDHALVVEVVEGVAEVPQHEADGELRQPRAESFVS